MDNPAENTTPPEVTLETVSTKEPDQLDDNDKKFLNDNAATLSDEVADKFGIIKPPPTEVTPLTRGGQTQTPAAPGKVTPTEGEEEEDDDLPDEDKKRIAKEVAKELAKHNISGVTQQVQEAQVTREVDEYISSVTARIPNASAYRPAMLAYAKHPSYKDVPVNAIFNIVAGNDLMKIGAQREREASTKAKDTQVNASTNRTQPGKKDWSTATKEEFEAEKARVLGRPS